MKKVIYETQWVARDTKKEYPHGWGFVIPLIEFPQDADPCWCSEICRQKLSNKEFECIGANVRVFFDHTSLFHYPKNEKEYREWKKNEGIVK